MAELSLISMRYAEAARLNSAAARGETEAVAFFRDLWPEMCECFFCGNPLAPGACVTPIMTHPRGKPGAAMLGRQCDTCSALPWQTRMHRLTKLFKLMFAGWRPTRPGWNAR